MVYATISAACTTNPPMLAVVNSPPSIAPSVAPNVIRSPISVATAVGVLFHFNPPCISTEPDAIPEPLEASTRSPYGFDTMLAVIALPET